MKHNGTIQMADLSPAELFNVALSDAARRRTAINLLSCMKPSPEKLAAFESLLDAELPAKAKRQIRRQVCCLVAEGQAEVGIDYLFKILLVASTPASQRIAAKALMVTGVPPNRRDELWQIYDKIRAGKIRPCHYTHSFILAALEGIPTAVSDSDSNKCVDPAEDYGERYFARTSLAAIA